MTAWTRTTLSRRLASLLSGIAPALSAVGTPVAMTAACGLALVASTGTAHAQQSPAQQAEALNERGKQQFAEKNYEGAYNTFREAATISPEGRFFFNMCYALNFLERYQEAITACEQVEAAGADAALKEKTDRALVSLREKLAAQGGSTTQPPPDGTTTPPPDGTTTPPPDGTTTPPTGGTSGGTAAGGGAAPAADPFITGSSGPIDSYKWSVGGELGVLGNGFGEDRNGDKPFAAVGYNLRLFANFIFNEEHRLGVQGSLAFGGFAPSEDYDQNLTMADVGVGVFSHRPLAPHLYWTPLIGLQGAIQQPDDMSQGYIALGARAEIGLSYVFGPESEHSINFTPGINLYLPSNNEVDGIAPSAFGFDKGRASLSANVGYTYRFSTPFGATPLITLE